MKPETLKDIPETLPGSADVIWALGSGVALRWSPYDVTQQAPWQPPCGVRRLIQGRSHLYNKKVKYVWNNLYGLSMSSFTTLSIYLLCIFYRDCQCWYCFDTKGKVRPREYSYDYLLVGMCVAAYRKRYLNQQCEATKNYCAYLPTKLRADVVWCPPPPRSTDSWCTHRNDVYTFARNPGIAWL